MEKVPKLPVPEFDRIPKATDTLAVQLIHQIACQHTIQNENQKVATAGIFNKNQWYTYG